MNSVACVCVHVFTCVQVYKTVIIIDEAMNLRVSGGELERENEAVGKL